MLLCPQVKVGLTLAALCPLCASSSCRKTRSRKNSLGDDPGHEKLCVEKSDLEMELGEMVRSREPGCLRV